MKNKPKMKDMLNSKKQRMVSAAASLFLIGSLFISCDKENEPFNEDFIASEVLNAYEINEVDDISENINDIVESAYFELANNILSKSGESKSTNEFRFLSDCVTITKVISAQNIQLTLDYGGGCTTKKEDVLSGKLFLIINPNLEGKSVTIDCSFENFHFNNTKIEGMVNKVRTRSNENGNPQTVINRDIKILWEDGSHSLVKGETTREWIEGVKNMLWTDNVFSINGSWTIIKSDGNTRTITIVEPLIRNMACRFLVSGVLEIENNARLQTLDYGNGDCDDLAILKVNGASHEIHLRKKRP